MQGQASQLRPRRQAKDEGTLDATNQPASFFWWVAISSLHPCTSLLQDRRTFVDVFLLPGQSVVFAMHPMGIASSCDNPISVVSRLKAKKGIASAKLHHFSVHGIKQSSERGSRSWTLTELLRTMRMATHELRLRIIHVPPSVPYQDPC